MSRFRICDAKCEFIDARLEKVSSFGDNRRYSYLQYQLCDLHNVAKYLTQALGYTCTRMSTIVHVILPTFSFLQCHSCISHI